MPKRSRKLGAVGTEVNLLPAAASSLGEKSAAGAAVEPSFEFRGENESGQPLSAVLAEAVDRIRSVTGADGAVIALMGAWGLICSASTGTAPVIGSRLQSYSGLTRECLESGQVVVCEDTECDARVEASVAKGLRLRSAALAPIVGRGSVLGVIEIFSQKVSGFDSKQTADLLRMALLLGSLIPPKPQEYHPIDQHLEKQTVEEPRPQSIVGSVGSIWPALRVWALATLVLVVLLSDHRRHLAKPSVSTSYVSGPAGIGQEPAQNKLVSLHSLAGDKSKPLAQATDEHTPVLDASTKQPSLERPDIRPSGLESAHEADEKGLSATPPQATEVRAKLEPPPLQILASSPPAELPMFGVGPEIPAVMRLRDSSPQEFVLDGTLQGHSSWVTAVAFSADGRKLASGSWDQSVKFWDVRTGQQLSIVANKMQGVEALAFSRDGQWLAAENASDAVTLWDGNTGREVRTLTSNKPLGVLGNNWVYSIAFSPDGRWLASAVDAPSRFLQSDSIGPLRLKIAKDSEIPPSRAAEAPGSGPRQCKRCRRARSADRCLTVLAKDLVRNLFGQARHENTFTYGLLYWPAAGSKLIAVSATMQHRRPGCIMFAL